MLHVRGDDGLDTVTRRLSGISYFTFHSETPADAPGCILTSRRSADVVTRSKPTWLYWFSAIPYLPEATTGFHSEPLLYRTRQD